jgi:Ca2+-binding RTX toxin-like protein
MAILAIDGTGGDDTIVITATGTDSGSYSINGGPAIAFSGVTQVAVSGGAGNDTLTIVNPDGSLFAPTGGISYDGGGQPADALELVGGTAADLIYTAGATRDAGTLVHTGEAGTQTIAFSGIAPITDITPTSNNVIINGTAGADTISVTDGGVVGGVQTTQVSSPTFESIRFANKPFVVTIDGQGGGDTVSFNNPNPAAGLTTLNVTGVDTVSESGPVKVANLSITATGNVQLTDSGNQIGTFAANVGGTLSVTDSSPLSVGFVAGTNGITATNHNVTLTADSLDIQQPIDAGSGTVTLQPLSAGRTIGLGSPDGVSVFGLTDAELDHVTAGALRIGNSSAGTIAFNAPISPAGTSQLELVTAADIQDDHGNTFPAVTVPRLAMTAGTGIGVSGANFFIYGAVDQIEAQTNTGGLYFSPTNGSVSVGGVTPDLTGLKVLTSGPLSIYGDASITLADPTASIVAPGSVFLLTGPHGSLTLATSGAAAVSSTSGDVEITSNRVVIARTSGITAAAPGHHVTIEPFFGAVNLGSMTDNAANTLELSDDELDLITTPTLRIGDDSNTTNITVSQPITQNAAHYGTLSLHTAGAILDGTAGEQPDIIVNNLALRAASGIGSADDLNVAVSKLAFANTTSGNVDILNAGAASIDAVDGLASSSNAGGFAAVFSDGGPLTDAAPITATGFILLDTSDTAAPGEDLTVLAPATLHSNAAIQLAAGDNVTVQAGATVQAGTFVAVNPDYFGVDPGVGGTASISGTIIAPQVNITGSADADTLIGSAAAERLDGGAGADVMAGGAGNDGYTVDNAGDVVIENPVEGTDTVFTSVNYGLPANVENMTLNGGADLQAFGNALANTIFANPGNNLVDGGAGADTMIGGFGNDTYFVDNAGDTVVENANEGNDTVFASVNFTLPANVENLILQGNADLQGYGNGLSNVVYGNAGNDLLNGGGGVDLMVGGAGNDTYFVDDPSDACFEVAGQGNDAVFASCNYGLAADVETLVMQGSADLQGYGNNQANTLYGNAGNNLLNGGGGIDLMVGGAGNDTYFVDDPSDATFENPGEGNDAVFATCNYGLAADVETLVMQGSGNFQGYGNNTANTLYGNSGNNLINGGGGADTMLGGAGNDTYFVDNIGDVVVENAGEGTDVVLSGVSYTLSANVEALVLQGAGNLAGTGNAQANNIFGNSGDNALDGGGGADTMLGGAGNDTFVFHMGQGDGDTVVDFAGNGAAVGDLLHFIGYGAGATFTKNDATHWQVNFSGGTQHEVITFSNGALIDPTDVLFS